MRKSIQEWFEDLVCSLNSPETQTNYAFGSVNRIVRKIRSLKPERLPRSLRLSMGSQLFDVMHKTYPVWPIEVTMLAVHLIDRTWHSRDNANPKLPVSPVYRELKKRRGLVTDGSFSRLLIYDKTRMLQHKPAERYAIREAARILETEAKRQYNPDEIFPMSTGDQYGF